MGGLSKLTPEESDDLEMLGYSPMTYQRTVDAGLRMTRQLLGTYKLSSVVAEKVVRPGALIDEPDWAGTADVIGVSKRESVLLVADLKTGRLAVGVERNAQMLSYAAGALAMLSWRPTKIVTAVIQPPISSSPSVWETTPDDVEAFVEEARQAIALINSGADLADPTDANCRWCPCRTVCPDKK
mgnify:CR=1 FL=1